MISGYYYNIVGEEGMGHSTFIRELDDSHVGHMLAVAPSSTCHEQKNSASLRVPVSNSLKLK